MLQRNYGMCEARDSLGRLTRTRRHEANDKAILD